MVTNNSTKSIDLEQISILLQLSTRVKTNKHFTMESLILAQDER